MASTEIADPQSPLNGHDSTDQPQPPQDPETQAPQDDAVSGDKRKREEEGSDAKPAAGQHPLWKTSLCSFFRRHDASCGHGSGCRYAHSEAELRPRPDNTWDPTSERAKKAAKKSGEDKECAAWDDVMMTEALDDDEDGDGDGDGDGGDGFGSDPALSKCLVHLPRNWKSDKLKEFLSEQASASIVIFFFLLVFSFRL
jgi:tRNA (uracil-5-)-methyltransferase